MLPGTTYLAALIRTSKHPVFVQANTMSRVDEHGNVTGRMSMKCAEMRRLRADCNDIRTLVLS